MSLRARFVLALVGLVAVATALIGAFSYRTTRAELLGQLDSSLQATTADLRRPGGVDRVLGPRSPASIRGDSDVIVQVVGADGTVYSMDGAAPRGSVRTTRMRPEKASNTPTGASPSRFRTRP